MDELAAAQVAEAEALGLDRRGQPSPPLPVHHLAAVHSLESARIESLESLGSDGVN